MDLVGWMALFQIDKIHYAADLVIQHGESACHMSHLCKGVADNPVCQKMIDNEPIAVVDVEPRYEITFGNHKLEFSAAHQFCIASLKSGALGVGYDNVGCKFLQLFCNRPGRPQCSPFLIYMDNRNSIFFQIGPVEVLGDIFQYNDIMTSPFQKNSKTGHLSFHSSESERS